MRVRLTMLAGFSAESAHSLFGTSSARPMSSIAWVYSSLKSMPILPDLEAGSADGSRQGSSNIFRPSMLRNMTSINATRNESSRFESGLKGTTAMAADVIRKRLLPSLSEGADPGSRGQTAIALVASGYPPSTPQGTGRIGGR